MLLKLNKNMNYFNYYFCVYLKIIKNSMAHYIQKKKNNDEVKAGEIMIPRKY